MAKTLKGFNGGTVIDIRDASVGSLIIEKSPDRVS
jgi:hypothetical protein